MSRARRLALLVAYRGEPFHGFQRQQGLPTVQEELERAWAAVTGETVQIEGSGRTDRGVHAHGQVAHLSSWASVPEEKLRPALNSYLPDEIVVRAAAEVEPAFHARFSATGKRYLYLLALGPTRPVLRAGSWAWERRVLDPRAMRAAVPHLLGEHDFASFQAAGASVRDTVRQLRAVHLLERRGGLAILFEGDGFLYKMVRNLVGTLLEVGRGRRHPEWVAEVLAARDRRRAGPTAPAEGLYLWRVLYQNDPFRGRDIGYS